MDNNSVEGNTMMLYKHDDWNFQTWQNFILPHQNLRLLLKKNTMNIFLLSGYFLLFSTISQTSCYQCNFFLLIKNIILCLLSVTQNTLWFINMILNFYKFLRGE